MRRITVLALVAVIALLGAACGGDDDDSSSDDTEATDDAATTDDGGEDSDDGGGDGGDLGAVLEGMGGCTGAAAAVSASMVSALNPAAAQEIEDQAFFEDFEANVPDDIEDDVDLMAEYFDAYAEAMGEFDASDIADPDKRDEFQQTMEALQESYPSEDLEEASDNIDAWFTDECPALYGSG